MLFERYKNEDEFRNLFIRPLLTKLGFLSIAELDGPQEFGKDFVFSEVTPFGFMRHYAVVAKHEKKLNQPGKLCETVLSQIRQAFSVSFSLPESGRNEHISSVLVMNSGNISTNAEKWLRSELLRERYGENTHIFSSERLIQLDSSVEFNEQRNLIPKIRGIISTIDLNLIVWDSMNRCLPQFQEARGCFTRAFEDYIALPFLSDNIPYVEIATLLQECRIIDSINTRYLLGIRGKNEKVRDSDIKSFKSLLHKATVRATALKLILDKCLVSFAPISEPKLTSGSS
ncbi:MAG: hypothetical protein OEZ58_07115 [Gammaproteobacteria bacterium]|nr:hypothetical protein [Gammaproteobacteria bacterium]